MTARTERLRRASLDAIPSISGERAAITTAFYKEQMGRHSIPVLRAMNFYAICDSKTLWMGDGELIVGERGPTAEGGADVSRAHLPQRRGSAHPRLAPEDAVQGRPGGHRRLRARGHPLLARPLPARPDVQRVAAGLARRLRGRLLHRVHGAARAGPHRGRRQALPQGDARLQSRHRDGGGGARLRARPRGPRQARATAGHVHRLRRGDALRSSATPTWPKRRPRRRRTTSGARNC